MKADAWFFVWFTALYMILGAITLSFWPKELVPPIYLPFGFVFAGVIVYGKKAMPGIFFGTVGTVLLQQGSAAEALLLPAFDLLFSIILLSLLRWIVGEKKLLDDIIPARNFLLVIVFFALPLYASLAATTLSIFYPADYSDNTSTALHWWMGDVVAVVFLGGSLTLFLRRIKSG